MNAKNDLAPRRQKTTPRSRLSLRGKQRPAPREKLRGDELPPPDRVSQSTSEGSAPAGAATP